MFFIGIVMSQVAQRSHAGLFTVVTSKKLVSGLIIILLLIII